MVKRAAKDGIEMTSFKPSRDYNLSVIDHRFEPKFDEKVFATDENWKNRSKSEQKQRKVFLSCFISPVSPMMMYLNK